MPPTSRDFPAALEAAIVRYQATDDLIRVICADAGISTSALYKTLQARNIPRRGASARVRFVLPDGRTVVGTSAVVAALGISHTAIYRAAVWDRDAFAWRIREPRPAGRPAQEAVRRELRPEPARCPHCGGALETEARRGG
jgi:hypothetical protein